MAVYKLQYMSEILKVLTISVCKQATQSIKASISDLSDIAGTSSNGLYGSCSKVLVRARHIGLELTQNSGDVRLSSQVSQNLKLEIVYKGESGMLVM